VTELNKSKGLVYKFGILLKDKVSVRYGFLASVLYLILYMWSIGSIRGGQAGVWQVDTAPNMMDMIFRSSAPFLWEASVRWVTPLFTLVFAPMNLLLGLVLTDLVFLNLAATINLYRQPKSCRLDAGTKGIWAIVPSFLSGFACCVPTFLIPLASVSASLTVYVIWLRQFLIPLSVLLLMWGAWYAMKRVQNV